MPDMATRRDLSGGAMACDASVQHAPREESKDRSRWRRGCYRARAHYHVSTRLSGHQQRQPVSDLHPPLPTRSRTGHKGSPAPAGCSVTPLARGSHDAAWPNFGRKMAVVASKSRTQSTNNGGGSQPGGLWHTSAVISAFSHHPCRFFDICPCWQYRAREL